MDQSFLFLVNESNLFCQIGFIGQRLIFHAKLFFANKAEKHVDGRMLFLSLYSCTQHFNAQLFSLYFVFYYVQFSK